MARQSGIIKLKGTIGGISFFKSADGYMAREKGGVDSKRIASDPAFKRTRENGQEFGRAGKAGKLVRNALRTLLQNARDARMVSRLTKALLAIIKTDTENTRGSRTVEAGNMNALSGFDFNINGKLETTLYAEHVKTLDRTTGELGLTIAPFNPLERIAAPAGATHFKVSGGGAELDFANGSFNFASADSGMLPLTSANTEELDLGVSLTAETTLPILQVMSVEFYQEVNGEMYALNNGAYNAMSILQVDQSA